MSNARVAVVILFIFLHFSILHFLLYQVTGSNKGIGFAIIKELCAKFDGIVYLTSRDEARGQSAVEQLNKIGLHPKFHQLDIDDENSVIRLRDHLKETYGGLDVLINNAAIATWVNNYMQPSTEPFREQATATLRTNFFNTLNICKILFPILRPHARVVNLSSSLGHLKLITGKTKAAIELMAKLSSSDLTEEELCKMMEQFIKYVKIIFFVNLRWYYILFFQNIL